MKDIVERVRVAVASLDGKVYEDRESLDDAVYPFFGPLTDVYQGQSHRDLVDKMINAGWVKKENDKLVVKIPVPTTEEPSE